MPSGSNRYPSIMVDHNRKNMSALCQFPFSAVAFQYGENNGGTP